MSKKIRPKNNKSREVRAGYQYRYQGGRNPGRGCLLSSMPMGNTEPTGVLQKDATLKEGAHVVRPTAIMWSLCLLKVGPLQQVTKRCGRTVSHCSGLSERTIPDVKTWQKFLPWGPRQGKQGTCILHKVDGASVWAHPPKKVHGGQFFAASESSHALELDQALGKLRDLPRVPSDDSRPLLELKESRLAGCCKHHSVLYLCSVLVWGTSVLSWFPFRLCGFRIHGFLF